MTSKSLSATELEHAVAILRAGELLAFPTETVYGLGADAANPDAVRKIFALKGRPSSHPVIVHLADQSQLQHWARDVSPTAQKLANAFWPGPFTLVLKRAAHVSDVVTGGQDTIAIRVPNHPIAQQLLHAFGGGIVAPSANRFGHVSPTLASHVRDEFGDALLILDGDDCEIGLESTIVSCVDEVPRLLRPGGITLSQLRAVVPEVTDVVSVDAPRAPGMLERHYSPSTPVHMVSADQLQRVVMEHLTIHNKVAVLALRPAEISSEALTWINAGSDAASYAHGLYANLRTLDKADANLIVVEQVPGDEHWTAVRDRLQRAAAPEL
jgi:L-threonylcarbamoyladenylate synthase